MIGEVQIQMPRYKCHKEVSALKISRVDHVPTKPTEHDVNEDAQTQAVLHFEDEGFAPIEVSTTWIRKHNPKAGGYYVVYEDGYTSFSPARPFEEGYKIIPNGNSNHLARKELLEWINRHCDSRVKFFSLILAEYIYGQIRNIEKCMQLQEQDESQFCRPSE